MGAPCSTCDGSGFASTGLFCAGAEVKQPCPSCARVDLTAAGRSDLLSLIASLRYLFALSETERFRLEGQIAELQTDSWKKLEEIRALRADLRVLADAEVSA